MITHKHTQTGKHRWLVAAPLFVLFLVLSVRDGFLPQEPQASLVISANTLFEAKADAKTVEHHGTVYVLEPGTVLDTQTGASLQAGTALVHSFGLSSTKAADFILEGWNGGYQVTVSGKTVTVAALSTPVLVSDGTHQTLIPALMQWKGETLASASSDMSSWYAPRRVLPLPPDFSHDRLLVLSGLVTKTSEKTAPSASLLPATFGQLLRFSAAKDRAETELRREKIATLRHALLSDVSMVDTLLLSSDMQDSLLSPEGQSAMPEILSAALLQGKGDLFLPFFVSAPNQLLLAVFHPLTRDHAWMTPQTTALTEDEHRSLLLLTPLSDTAPDMLATLAMEEWQAKWSSFVQTASGAKVFASALPLLRTQIDRLDTLQYPARADNYTTALLKIAEPIEKKLTPEIRHQLEDLRILRAERRLSAPLQEVIVASSAASSVSSAASSSSKHAVLSDNELVSQTEIFLQEAGFMSTSQTTFTPVDGVVQVSNIVFGTLKGDTTLRFLFDPVTLTVSGIEQNGQILPYDIPLSGFTEWLKQ